MIKSEPIKLGPLAPDDVGCSYESSTILCGKAVQYLIRWFNSDETPRGRSLACTEHAAELRGVVGARYTIETYAP